MRVEGGALSANLTRAVDMIRQAAAAGCELAVLPECLDLGWTHPSARTLGAEIPGARSEILATAACKHRIHVVAGLTEQSEGRVFNTAVLISPDGEILLKHRKINVLDIARDLYEPGQALNVARTPWGPVGVLICADCFPETTALGESLALMGARALFSPCAWAVPQDHDNDREPYGDLWLGSYSTLSTTHNLSIVGVSNVGPIEAGPWAGRKCIGASLVMGHGGIVLDRAPYGVDAACLRIVNVPVSR